MALRAQNLFNEQDHPILFPNHGNHNAKASYHLNSILKGDRFYDQPSTFYYKERARLHFAVADEFSKHFILIKGLIEFSRSSSLKFSFIADQKRIEINLEVNQFEELNQLFLTVHTEMLKEIRFKAALKKAIEFEQRYKQEAAKVYLTLF